MKKVEFSSPILKQPDIDATYIEFPFDVLEIFGKTGRIKVKVIFDEKIEYRGSLVKMEKDGCHLLGITKDIRKQINKSPGDQVKISIEIDNNERKVDLSDDLKDLLIKNSLLDKFLKLSYTHQKEYTLWLESAKKQATRNSRLIKFIEILSNK